MLKVPCSGWSVSRILSRMRIYLGRTSPNCSCGLPGNLMSRANSLSCLTLHRMGVTWPGLLPNPPVVSYTTFSTLRIATRYVSVALIQKLTPLQVLPGILLCGVRTFLTLRRARTFNQPERLNDSRIERLCLKFQGNSS